MSAHNLNIKILGVGGCGGNVVQYLSQHSRDQAKYAAINTDAQALNTLTVPEKLLIGHSLTRGLSTGNNPIIGLKAAKLDQEKIEALVEGVDLLFIVTGLGGGTGGGASPYIAKIAQKKGTLVFSFATLPFTIEGNQCHQQAEEGLGQLRLESNAVVPVPNDLLLQQSKAEATVLEAFDQVNSWVARSINAIIDAIFLPGIINLDFAILKNIFPQGGGKTLFGFAQAQGVDAVEEALGQLLLCPLLHIPQASQRADSLLINIKGGRDLSLKEVTQISSNLSRHFLSNDNTLIGAIIDDSLEQTIEICILGITDIYRISSRKKSKSQAAQDNPRQQVLFEGLDCSVSKRIHKSRSTPGTRKSSSNRGYFYETEKNIYHGEDLDIPTYLRRGIKIDF